MNNILIDNRWAGSGGIGTFAEEINKINNYEDAGLCGEPFSPLDSFKTSLKLLYRKSDIVFFPGYIPPVFSRTKYIFTIHDLNHIDRPENSSFLKRFFYNTIILNGCKKAEYIFTVSEFSRERIISWSKINPSKVINVGNGVSKKFNPNVRGDYYPFDYILCVSNRKSHKNEIKTLEAFKLAKFPKTMKFVFTGKPNDELESYIKNNGMADSVVFTGFVQEEELPALYRSAKALVFASLYEGFGLPVIEAMATGTPVVTSKTTSLGEIAGNAAILVNPESINEIKDAMIEVINNEDLRKKLILAGFAQAEKFTWENVAGKVAFYLEDLKKSS